MVFGSYLIIKSAFIINIFYERLSFILNFSKLKIFPHVKRIFAAFNLSTAFEGRITEEIAEYPKYVELRIFLSKQKGIKN